MKSKSIFLLLILSLSLVIRCGNYTKNEIFTLVSKNNVVSSVIDSMSPMAVGNGHFIFSTDITGLQTFPDFYSGGIPLITRADWSSAPTTKTSDSYQPGRVGLRVFKKNGIDISITDIEAPVQSLNMLTGEIESIFRIEDTPVQLKTVCHSDYDMISVKIISELIREKKLSIKIDFSDRASSLPGSSNSPPRTNTTEVLSDTNNMAIFERNLNNEKYRVMIWLNDAQLISVSQHVYYLEPGRSDSTYSFTCQFLKNIEDGRVQDFGETETASRKGWENFWIMNGHSNIRKFKEAQNKQLTADLIRSLYFNRLHSFLNTEN